MKQLRSLLLISQMDLQGPGLEVVRHLPALRELQLQLVTAGDDAFAVLSKCPKLEVLHLEHCTGIGAATLERIAQITTLRGLSLAGCSHLDEHWIAKVARLPQLERLDLGQIGSRTMFSGLSPVEVPEPGTGVTDVVCAALAEARKLRHLDLAYGDISALGIASLQDLPLLTLDLTGVDATKRHLAYLPATLTSLTLAGNVNDRDLSLLGMILAEETPALTSLNLQSSSVTDTGIASLHRMPALTSLNLGWCQDLTAEVVPELCKLEQLGSLDLQGLKWVTEAHLEQLRAMPNLTRLDAKVGGR